MSSPTEQTHSQDSYRKSSQHAVGAAVEDNATSAPRDGQTLGSSTAVLSVAPNSTYAQSCTLSRLRSFSPEQQWAVSLVELSVAQHCAQLAEQTVATAVSGARQVAEATKLVHGVTEGSYF